ncbi:hypothetical protein [Streptomyces sp. NPDC056549]|uniref:hypothetical protein n=1 Tax=Streptomyces sp. NPDC056549 TaxID=3345864 RepID=UPI003698CCFE
MPDTRCKACGRATPPDGAPTMVVAVTAGELVYACMEHAEELSAPTGDFLVILAQLLDIARRRNDGEL